MQVKVDAVQNGASLAGVHGNLFKLDPVMQQYLRVGTDAVCACPNHTLSCTAGSTG